MGSVVMVRCECPQCAVERDVEIDGGTPFMPSAGWDWRAHVVRCLHCGANGSLVLTGKEMDAFMKTRYVSA